MFLLEEPNFSKKYLRNTPNLPIFRIQISTPTLGGEFSPPEITPTHGSWVQPALCGYVKGPRLASNAHNPQKMPWHCWSWQSPGFFMTRSRRTAMGFNTKINITSGVYHVILHMSYVCILYIHACMYNICTLYIYIYIIHLYLLWYLPPTISNQLIKPRTPWTPTAMSPSSSNKTKAVGQSSEFRLVAPKAML